MSNSIRSLAILKAHPGCEQELIALLREFYGMMYVKHYSVDVLYRDAKQPDTFIHIRIWHTAEARETAVHDPEVHRYWIKMPELGEITTIFEELDPIFSTQAGLSEDILEGGG